MLEAALLVLLVYLTASWAKGGPLTLWPRNHSEKR